MGITESTKLIFEINKYRSDIEKDQEGRFTYNTDEHGCFSHNSTEGYSGPYPKKSDVQSNYNTYITDSHGCFNHRPGEDYTGPYPKESNVQSNYNTYETDSHGCFNHSTIHKYSGPILNTELNPQSNYATYETDLLGNMIDNTNSYTGPKPNQSEKAQGILKVDAAHKAKIEESLEKYFKKKSKRFLKGWYTTTIKKSTI